MKKITLLLAVVFSLSIFKVQAQCNDRPIINDFSPKTGFIGSTVTITGANFSATPSENQVFFGATQATIVSSSFGTLEVRVPEGSTTALISVKNQCNKTAYSKTHFNGIFCPTPLTSSSYQNVAQELTGIYGAYNMISQDMDNDGKPEVISARNGGGITIAKNNSSPGNISFSRYNNGATGGAAQSIAAADFDGDGLKDIVTNRAIMRNISTGPGHVGLQYVTHSRYVSSYQVGVGDFNNDGKIDIIGEYGNWIWVAFNTSTGPGNFNFTNRMQVKYVGARCTGIQVADVDGDGKADFLGSQGNGNRAVSIRNTTPNGSFTPTFENPEYWSSDSNWSDGRGTYPYRSMIADFDKDGKIDFTSCNYSSQTNTAIWRNTSTVGNISFAPSINIASPRNNYRIGVGDVDGDGYPDIVTKSLGVNVFSVYRNTSSGAGNVSFAPRFDYSSSSRAEVSGIVIGDLDGDFVPDIATSGISSNTIRFHRNTGAQNDSTAPTVACKNITVALSPNGTASITAEMIDNGSGDACGISSLVLSKTDFTCADIGENTVTLTATDAAGNTSSCTATVNVQPAAIIVAGQTTVCQGDTVEMNANVGDSYQWNKDGVAIAGATSQNYTATVSGSYTVNVTNAGGCSGESLATDIVVNNNPTVDISPAGNASFCSSDSATLTASQSSIYQWMKNGVDIANATQQEYNATEEGTYSVRVIDLFGCSAVSNDVVVTIADTIAPTVATQNVTVNIDAGSVNVTADQINNGSTDNCAIASLSLSQTSFTCADFGVNTVTLTVTDESGNTSTGTATVTVTGADNDTDGVPDVCDLDDDNDGILDTDECIDSDFHWSSAPVLSGGTATGTINGIGYTYSSNVSFSTTSYLFGHYKFPSQYNIPDQTSIRNDYASQNTLTFDEPMTNPVLVFASIGGGQPSPTVSIQFQDNFSVVWAQTSTTTVDLNAKRVTGTEGNIIIRFEGTFTELSFNYLNAESWVNFAFGADFYTHCDTDSDGIIDAFDADSDNDGCPDAIEAGHLDGNEDGVLGDATTVTVDSNGLVLNHGGYTGTTNLVTDSNLNGCNEPPVAKAKNITVYVDDNCSTSLENNAIDDGSSDPDGDEITYALNNNGPFAVGSYEVTMTVTDPKGETDTATATVTVLDNTDPVITSPADINVNTDYGICGAAVNFEATATDNCTVTVTYDIQPGTVFGVGTTVVTATATDASGNTSDSSFNITVVDNQVPNITSPFDITTNVDPDVCGAVVNYDIPTASDNCGTGTPPTALANHTYKGTLNGHTYFISNTRVTAEVAHANAIAAGGHLVTITDAAENLFVSQFNSGRIWIGATDRDVEGQWKWITNEPMNYTNWAPGEPNNYGAGEDWAVINWSGSNPNWNDWFFYATAYYAIEFDGGTLPTTLVSGPAPGEVFPVGTTTVTYEAVDASGNVAQTSFDVTVVDNQAPTVVTENITVQLDANGAATITTAELDGGSTDNCDIESISINNSSFDCSNVGNNNVTLTVTDVYGNTASGTAIVTVEDSVAPTVVTQNMTIQLDANGAASIVAGQIENGSTDNCGVASISLDQTSFDCSNLGNNTVTLTVTDVNGNSSTGTATVTVEDNIDPTISNVPANITVDAVDTSCSLPVSWDSPVGADNCTFTMTSTHNSGDTFDVGTTEVTYTVTDTTGNNVSASFTVTVNPIPMTLSLFSPTIGVGNVTCFGDTDGTVTPTVTGGCEPYSYSWTDSNGTTTADLSGVGAGTYTLTVSDDNGSSISESITLTEPALLEASIAEPATISLPTAAFGDGAHLLFGYPGNETTSVQLNGSSTGGNAGHTYSWTASADGLSDPTSPNPTFAPTMLKAGCTVYTLTLTVTDGYGCTTTEVVTINAVHVGVVVTTGKGKKQQTAHKVLVCHKGKRTISIDYHAVPAHLAHGDSLGSCESSCGDTYARAESHNNTLLLPDATVFPNPSDGVFEVKLSNVNEAAELLLFDLNGKLIERRSITAAQARESIIMDKSFLSSGVYLLKIVTNEETVTKKLLIQRE